MIDPASKAHRALFKRAMTRCGLSCAHDPGAIAFDRLDIGPGEGRDARQAPREVQRDALACEEGGGAPLQAHELGSGRKGDPFRLQSCPGRCRVYEAQRQESGVISCRAALLAAPDDRLHMRARVHHGVGRDVAPASQILQKGQANNGFNDNVRKGGDMRRGDVELAHAESPVSV